MQSVKYTDMGKWTFYVGRDANEKIKELVSKANDLSSIYVDSRRKAGNVISLFDNGLSHQKITSVFIEEIENGLTPDLQRSLPEDLSLAFPNADFFVSTHSPMIILGSPENSNFIRVQDDGSEKRLEFAEEQIKNLTANQVYFTVFDVSYVAATTNKRAVDIRTEDSLEALENNLQIEKSLGIVRKENRGIREKSMQNIANQIRANHPDLVKNLKEKFGKNGTI